MEKVLSICIPAYNVEKYINKTLDSIVGSVYLELLDVIVVNDGSTDRTASIVQEYVSQYSKSIKIVNKKNGGYGSVLNRGLSEAVGKYFCLLDGDDWYDTKEFDKILCELINQDVDMVISNHNRVDANTFEIKKMPKCDLDCNKLMSFDEAIDYMGYDKYFGITDIFIKRSIWIENNIKIDELTHYVDMEYCTYYVPYIKKVMYVNAYHYQYRVGNSQSGSQIEAMVKLYENHIQVTKSLINFYKGKQSLFSDCTCKYVKDKVYRMIKRDFEILLERYHRFDEVDNIQNYVKYIRKEGLFRDKLLLKWLLINIKSKVIYKIYYEMISSK